MKNDEYFMLMVQVFDGESTWRQRRRQEKAEKKQKKGMIDTGRE
jgi:hypothetical protein